jgi:hypothetical protein
VEFIQSRQYLLLALEQRRRQAPANTAGQSAPRRFGDGRKAEMPGFGLHAREYSAKGPKNPKRAAWPPAIGQWREGPPGANSSGVS